MLEFKNITIKEELSELGKRLNDYLKEKNKDDGYFIREFNLKETNEELKNRAKYVFELCNVKSCTIVLIFVNNDYEIKLGISSIILSVDVMNRLNKIINVFQRIVDDYIEDIESRDITHINTFLDVLWKIMNEKGNENE